MALKTALEKAPGGNLHAIRPHAIKSRIAGTIAALGYFCLAACAPSLTSQSFLSSDDLARTHSLRSAHIGFSARSLSDDKELYAIDQEKFFVPASITKLFTSAVSLVLLGPEFRFETGLYTDSPAKDGVIIGNIFIRGSGDPTLSARFHDEGGRTIFNAWADRLVALGVRRIDGDIVGDAGMYQGGPLGRGWSWDDELHCFSAQISALSFDDNCVSVLVAPGSHTGQKAEIAVNDLSNYVIASNETLTVQPDEQPVIFITRGGRDNLIIVSGRVPL